VREVVEFDDSHLAEAARLLRARHAEHRRLTPLLAPQFDAELQIRREWEAGSGVALLDGGRLRGYLVGAIKKEDYETCVWSGVAGQAVEDPSYIQDLYTHAARRWVDEGITRHYVFVPATRSLVEPWVRLSFGISATLAAQSLADSAPYSMPAWIRMAQADDAAQLASLERELDVQLASSPSFGGRPVPSLADVEEEWQGFDTDRRFTCFVAVDGADLTGFVLLFRRPHDSLRIPPLSIDLATAATAERHRGKGIGTALTRSAMCWAAERGYQTMTTDWRMTNRLAANFWPARGFTEVFLRLHRSVP
jgi:GNAT superfamily N-acetyltransferase